MFGVLGQAVVMFAVTNVDDIVLLALYFGQASGDRAVDRRIVMGQYLGFGAILAVSVLAALGLRLLPESAVAYLGLIPLALGFRAAFTVWRQRGVPNGESRPVALQPTASKIAGVTFSNGADNISVYIPVFTATGPKGIVGYAVVFLIMVGVWCAAGRYLATRPVVARGLARWGHILLPIVLITIGTLILIEGGAFGL
jgi:cadmium resistance protein CadD (predicted permease)